MSAPSRFTNRRVEEVIDSLLGSARDVLDMQFGYVAEFVDGSLVTRRFSGDAASFGATLGQPVDLPSTYCAHMVSGELPNAIPDARRHPGTAGMAATATAGIGAYAGVPIVLQDGSVFGSLCCLSHSATPIDDAQIGHLRLLSRLVAQVLEWRNAEQARAEDDRRRHAQAAAELEATQRIAGLGSWSFDPQTNTIDASAETLRLHGLAPGVHHELSVWCDTIDAADQVRLLRRVERLEAGAAPVAMNYRTTSGRTMEMRVASTASPAGGGTRYVGITMDVTERRRAELALRLSVHRTRQILDNAQDAFISMDSRGYVVDWNPQAEATFGWAKDAALGRNLAELIIPPRLREAHRRGLERIVATGASAVLGRRMELSALHRDGREFPVEITISGTGGDASRTFHAFVHDITQRKDAEQALERRSLHDHLTDLPNRALLVDRLEQALARIRRGGARGALLFIDIDNFRSVNDSLGHDRGDQLLLAVAQRLTETLRPEDTVARFSGDEFVVLCERMADERDAFRAAERIAAALDVPVTVGEHQLAPTASIGIAIVDASYTRPDDVIRDAEAAVYRAKDQGRGGHELFDSAMRDALVRRLQLERDLRLAVERGQLRVVYQPIVALDGSRVAAAEALARWEHPEHGNIPPADFIGLAEEASLIGPLGAWILREACWQAARWHAAGHDLIVSVNLSVRQLADPGLAATVRDALEVSGVPPDRLALELTESALIDTDGTALGALNSLKAIGVMLSLDDFGTGYSSLGYLSRLPLDMLKLDRSFVSEIVQDRRASAIVAAIAQLADGLDLLVVAEGIETGEQLAAVRALGCPLAQGFLFSRPLESDAMMDWIEGQTATKRSRA
jgi:diguanylate cyclase (GGDEF)-like protein/PAS domain S-box-containing protein